MVKFMNFDIAKLRVFSLNRRTPIALWDMVTCPNQRDCAPD